MVPRICRQSWQPSPSARKRVATCTILFAHDVATKSCKQTSLGFPSATSDSSAVTSVTTVVNKRLLSKRPIIKPRTKKGKQKEALWLAESVVLTTSAAN
jgi:hypothetical protein